MDKSTLAQRLFDSRDAYFEVEAAVDEMFGDILGISYDDYDSSLEIFNYKGAAIEPTPEQQKEILSWGFQRFWVNYEDGTERYYTKDGAYGPSKSSWNRWESFNSNTASRHICEKRTNELEQQLAAIRTPAASGAAAK